MILGFAGNITPEEAREMVDKYWLPNMSTTESQPNLANVDARKVVSPDGQFLHRNINDMRMHDGTILIPTPNMYSMERFPLAFVNYALGANLFKSVREKLGLVYGIQSSPLLEKIGGFLSINFACVPENTEKVLAAIYEEIEKLKNNTLTEKEMMRYKNSMIAGHEYGSENVSKVVDLSIDTLAFRNRTISTEEMAYNINAVQQSDVQDFAIKWLDLDSATVAIAGPDADRIQSF